jgi:hypothetical protein
VFDAVQDLSFGCTIARQFVCNKHPWDILAPFAQGAPGFRKNFLAAALFRRLCTRMSKMVPC